LDAAIGLSATYQKATESRAIFAVRTISALQRVIMDEGLSVVVFPFLGSIVSLSLALRFSDGALQLVSWLELVRESRLKSCTI